jgi:hypothetical protein
MADQDRNGVETVTGVVEATNVKGIKVGGRWWNYSQYAAVPRPEIGQWVTLEARGRFISKLLLQPAPIAAGGAVPPDLATAERSKADGLRQAMIQAAASFLAARGDATPADVVAAAALWESWVLRCPAP